jgi:hypothetical protein
MEPFPFVPIVTMHVAAMSRPRRTPFDGPSLFMIGGFGSAKPLRVESTSSP